jgi:hypothetical protein
MNREDDALMLGLTCPQNPMALSGQPILTQLDSDALTCRERSTLFGLLRLWPQCERRRISGPWNGVERRAGRVQWAH